jgi:hypothetical protein
MRIAIGLTIRASLMLGYSSPISALQPKTLKAGNIAGVISTWRCLRLKRPTLYTPKIGFISLTRNLLSGSESYYPILGQGRQNESHPPRIILPTNIYLRG